MLIIAQKVQISKSNSESNESSWERLVKWKTWPARTAECMVNKTIKQFRNNKIFPLKKQVELTLKFVERLLEARLVVSNLPGDPVQSPIPIPRFFKKFFLGEWGTFLYE